MVNIIPQPNGAVLSKEGRCVLNQTVQIENEEFPAWCTAAFLERTGCRPGPSGIKLVLVKDDTLSREAYKLEISPDKIEVTASGPEGVIQALTSAAVMKQGKMLPCCLVEDEPVYEHRGVHLDCARHFFDAKAVKEIIEGMSLAKLNVLHWHLSDDQGWRIESLRFPKLHETSKDYYTQKEIRDIVAFAKDRGVEIIPEIDMPGHTTAILAAYPQYSCSGKKVSLASSMGIYPVILCPGKEETFEFLEQLLGEIVPLFEGPRFHIGGDEAPKTEWARCPDCQRRMQELGLGSLDDLQGYFTRRVQDILAKFGKQAVCWNDTLLASNAPKDVQIQYWTLQHRSQMEPMIEQGGRWIYSDMFELYFDYPHSMTSLKKVYETNPHLGKREVGPKDGLIGMEGCVWTEHIDNADSLERRLFPRVFALAEVCWSRHRNYESFEQRLRAMMPVLENSVSVTEQDSWNPKGKQRRKEALSYFTGMNSSMSKEVREQTVESAKPNKEFSQSFMTKFFKTADLPFLAMAMLKK